MISKEQRVEELHDLLAYIATICTIYDLRVGQLLYNVFGAEDIFSLENAEVRSRIEAWIKGEH